MLRDRPDSPPVEPKKPGNTRRAVTRPSSGAAPRQNSSPPLGSLAPGAGAPAQVPPPAPPPVDLIPDRFILDTTEWRPVFPAEVDNLELRP